VIVQTFIDLKSSQLVYYVQAYWNDCLPYRELEYFMWDTLEEWSQITHTNEQLYSHKERVFWHLFHQTQFVSADTLKHDPILKEEVALCFSFLLNNKACPLDVVGMRP